MTDSKYPPVIDHQEKKEKDAHLEALKSADNVLKETQVTLSEGRRRLQASIDRYKERLHDPR